MKITFQKMIRDLYKDMDRIWNRIAGQYGFICNGCTDNCCESLFFHHTHVEKDYLLQGVSALPAEKHPTIIEKARRCTDRLLLFNSPGQPYKMMCPLNENSRCLIYEYRPMICRLHGLPHELAGSGGRKIRHPGCRAGESCFTAFTYIPFDRTPIYRQMAELEKKYVKAVRPETPRIRLTIAQMLES